MKAEGILPILEVWYFGHVDPRFAIEVASRIPAMTADLVASWVGIWEASRVKVAENKKQAKVIVFVKWVTTLTKIFVQMFGRFRPCPLVSPQEVFGGF